jgi:beta-glucosidase
MLEAEAERIARQADAVVLVLGLTPELEGEALRIEVDGFRGGDRTDLGLPPAQRRLLRRILAVGRPTVLVLMNGGPVALPESASTVLEAWYPGQAGGTAIADVLFGAHNPAGRLPVTVHRDAAELPPFDDYRMAGRTYRFFDGTPQFPFGHGLSYTSFAYDRFRTDRDTLRAAGSITIAVDITNTGARAGEEVVQLYVRHPASTVPRARRDLRGYERVALRPQETRAVTFALDVSGLAFWDETADRWTVEPGSVVLEVGASSADIRHSRTVIVVP